MNAPFEPAVVALAAYGIPLTYLGAAALGKPTRPLATAGLASAVSFALAAIVAAATAVGDLSGTHLGLRLDLVTAVMLTLVTFIGLVITRYSRTYLDGDPGRQRYTRWLMVTLSAVATLISTAHIGLLAAAWTVTSLALHQLLTFFRNRPAAQVAAHKKFLVSRLADLCLWTGIALLYGRVGSLWMGDVEAWIATLNSGGASLPLLTVYL
ncbi:MAG: proton-conducting transporter membrane subunit [Planctomycetota bacterium]